jgi:hypothetical protein
MYPESQHCEHELHIRRSLRPEPKHNVSERYQVLRILTIPMYHIAPGLNLIHLLIKDSFHLIGTDHATIVGIDHEDVLLSARPVLLVYVIMPGPHAAFAYYINLFHFLEIPEIETVPMVGATRGAITLTDLQSLHQGSDCFVVLMIHVPKGDDIDVEICPDERQSLINANSQFLESFLIQALISGFTACLKRCWNRRWGV